jgi:hypothetical protein
VRGDNKVITNMSTSFAKKLQILLSEKKRVKSVKNLEVVDCVKIGP